jgi:hypothetical protein
VELLALFNHPPAREGQAKYYTVKVPLKVQNRDEGVKGVEANWLDYMTQHFNNGASLVDGYFHLGGDNGKNATTCRLWTPSYTESIQRIFYHKTCKWEA